MRLLDLFCGAGGAAVGYNRAGFDEIIGIDNKPQKHYPFDFFQMDAMDYLKNFAGDYYDLIHASPPCQAYSVATKKENRSNHPDYIVDLRKLLIKTKTPYVIENVPGAPMAPGTITLCGLMFNLKVFRHRHFETSFFCLTPGHPSHFGKRIGEGYYCVAGAMGKWRSWGGSNKDATLRKGTISEWREAMGIDWMTGKELTQAIPPAYTEFIGKQFFLGRQ